MAPLAGLPINSSDCQLSTGTGKARDEWPVHPFLKSLSERRHFSKRRGKPGPRGSPGKKSLYWCKKASSIFDNIKFSKVQDDKAKSSDRLQPEIPYSPRAHFKAEGAAKRSDRKSPFMSWGQDLRYLLAYWWHSLLPAKRSGDKIIKMISSIRLHLPYTIYWVRPNLRWTQRPIVTTIELSNKGAI